MAKQALSHLTIASQSSIAGAVVLQCGIIVDGKVGEIQLCRWYTVQVFV